MGVRNKQKPKYNCKNNPKSHLYIVQCSFSRRMAFAAKHFFVHLSNMSHRSWRKTLCDCEHWRKYSTALSTWTSPRKFIDSLPTGKCVFFLYSNCVFGTSHVTFFWPYWNTESINRKLSPRLINSSEAYYPLFLRENWTFHDHIHAFVKCITQMRIKQIYLNGCLFVFFLFW